MTGESWKQKLEAVGHTVFIQEAEFKFSLLYPLKTVPQSKEWFFPNLGCLPISVILIKKIPLRFARKPGS